MSMPLDLEGRNVENEVMLREPGRKARDLGCAIFCESEGDMEIDVLSIGLR